MESPVVFLDDSIELISVFNRLLQRQLGLQCQGYTRLSQLEVRTMDVMSSKLAILDVNLGPGEPNGIDAMHWLLDHGYQGKIVFLTGHAQSNPMVRQALNSGIEVLEKPLRAPDLLDLVKSATSPQ